MWDFSGEFKVFELKRDVVTLPIEEINFALELARSYGFQIDLDVWASTISSNAERPSCLGGRRWFRFYERLRNGRLSFDQSFNPKELCFIAHSGEFNPLRWERCGSGTGPSSSRLRYLADEQGGSVDTERVFDYFWEYVKPNTIDVMREYTLFPHPIKPVEIEDIVPFHPAIPDVDWSHVPEPIGFDLSGCDLSYVDFFGCDLRNSDFRGADLSHANLSEANLIGAKYERTDLSYACLDGARFSDLTGATLKGTVPLNGPMSLSHALFALSQQFPYSSFGKLTISNEFQEFIIGVLAELDVADQFWILNGWIFDAFGGKVRFNLGSIESVVNFTGATEWSGNYFPFRYSDRPRYGLESNFN
ncbi:MAG: pentapeptide repeat-containing protein [Actinobacteria bacterium]|nr:pentapeptide repeat-containing protein [Actinomycetota bacterium]